MDRVNDTAISPLTPRGLERRLKRHVRKETHAFLAVGAPGFETVLLQEVKALPEVTEARIIRGGVEFSGPLETIYHANLHLATAHRVLWRVADFLAQSYPMLYNKVQRVPWEHYLGFNGNLRIRVSAKSSKLNHQQGVAETVLAAMNSTLGLLGLSVHEAEDAALELHARLFQDRCTLSLDTSGEHLHRRGYRSHVGEAPLRETLAAALLKTAEFEQYDLILDPMCGSGTFLLEAARMLRGFPPGSARPFAFEALPIFQPGVWDRFKRKALADAGATGTTLLGYDRDTHVLKAAGHNAEEAGVADSLTFAEGDARTLPYADLKRSHDRALVICNPPYGKRLSAGEARRLYAELSAVLASSPGLNFAILTPEPDWVLLPVSKRLEFQNGGLKVFLMMGNT